MDLQLDGKRALVTGSNSGIGKGIATVLAREGARVIIHGRDSGRAHAVAREINENCGHAVVALGDLATDQGAKSVVDAALAQAGGVDILVNNHGGNDTALDKNPDWFDVNAQDWGVVMQQNTISCARLILALVPAMRERGWGRVINIGSFGGYEPTAQVPNYCAAKAALANLTLSLSKALAGSGVTANTVSPGFIRSGRFETWVLSFAQHMGWEGNVDDFEARIVKQLSLNASRCGRVEDIGNMVAFLASPLAAFVSGADLRVDGGQSHAVN